MHWFKEGDQNTKFFHSYVKGRRKKLEVHRIEDSQGKLLELPQKIREEAIKIFQDQFTESNNNNNFEYLNMLPVVLNEKDREQMERWPEDNEIREVVFDLNKDSVSRARWLFRGFLSNLLGYY